ncbi:MAG: hypothetical protein ACKV2T_35350 [Kofleriaceae bacterium]
MPTSPDPEGTPAAPMNAAEALRARLRAVAQVEQSKRGAEPVPPPAPAKVAEPTGSSGLWEAPKAQVEEPISPFLIPIDEPLRPHERVAVAPVLRAPLPPARAVSLPAEPPPVEVHRVSLEQHIETLLTLLRTEEVDEAIAQQDAPTRDSGDSTIRSRWHLTRELLGVAKSLPPRVTQVLATAIGRDNLEGAKPDLVAYRENEPKLARESDVVLRTRAKSIQRGVAGALYVEPIVYTPPAQFQPAPNYESPKSSGANFIWVGAVIVLAIIRFASSNRSSSYDYSYTPSYNYNSSPYSDDYQRTAALMEAMEANRQAAVIPAVAPVSPYEEPDVLDKEASQELLVDQIERSLLVLRENGWLTTAQSEKMTDFWVTSPYHSECKDARAAMKAWEKLKMSDELPLAKRHIKAIRGRVDTLCPATKKKAAKKKAAPVEKMELTDTPPQ